MELLYQRYNVSKAEIPTKIKKKRCYIVRKMLKIHLRQFTYWIHRQLVTCRPHSDCAGLQDGVQFLHHRQ